jgi:hypothetical protein
MSLRLADRPGKYTPEDRYALARLGSQCSIERNRSA